ncbi:desiccation-related protein PCC13-62-like [Oryza brachyantha]|uniref:desiccation-related protein PCC13-62-like n=1 Tax=Oryza brachyantha TaxID=4533 RepID=UPI001AD9A282|nr:desiccation-related protein PCC13-62-like [Oryza brachyantha]
MARRAVPAALLLLLHLLPAATPDAPPPSAGGDDPRCHPSPPRRGAVAVYPSDMAQLQFLLNAKFVEAEWFLHAALGRGVDSLDRNLSAGGPPPSGARKAALDFRTTEVAAELGYQEVGHIRAITQSMGGFPRPAIDLSDGRFAAVMDEAMGARLDPPFDAYASSVNFLLASYILPHITTSAAVGISPSLIGFASKRLQASILAVEAGQDAVIRLLLYQRADEVVAPYKGHTVAEFTRRISDWRNGASRCGAKDEGVKVLDRRQGAERRTISNILGAGDDSLGFARTPAEVLRILYGSRNEQIPGGFLPRGGNGTIARGFFQLA